MVILLKNCIFLRFQGYFIFNFSPSGECISYCGFLLHFPDDLQNVGSNSLPIFTSFSLNYWILGILYLSKKPILLKYIHEYVCDLLKYMHECVRVHVFTIYKILTIYSIYTTFIGIFIIHIHTTQILYIHIYINIYM